MISQISKIFIFLGILLLLFGFLFELLSQISFFGKLPGDIYIKRGKFEFYFPLASCILISVFLSFLFYFLSRFFK